MKTTATLFPNTLAGARGALAEMADHGQLPGILIATGRRDPEQAGVWELRGKGWRAIVYLAGHFSGWNGEGQTENDFETETEEEYKERIAARE